MIDTIPMTDIDRWSLLTGLATRTLADNWFIHPVAEFRQGSYGPDAADWLPITIPSHWQQHPELADFAGKAVYRCHFNAPGLGRAGNGTAQASRAWLRFNGVFYWSHPYLNGVDLGRNEGYFAPYEREVTGSLQAENTLVVEVDCPDEHNKINKRMITGVFSHWDCLDPMSNPGGIWLPVELHYSGSVRLHSVRCHTESFNQHFAQMHYAVDIDAAAAGPVVLRWTITPQTFAGAAQTVVQRRNVRAGQRTLSGLFKLHEPRLWWTHDLGRSDLYTIKLEVLTDEVLSDQTLFVFGVRRFELRNWIPHLNGVQFLIKGNNYAPGDMRPATMTMERCVEDMRLVKECHMNFLRMHAHVEHPAMYQAANEAGVLLWQDMPLQWLYSADVLPEAQRQVRAMIRLLYNHPSIGVWCMHNEPVFVSDTSDERRATRWRTYASAFGFSWNRDVMDTQLKQVAHQEDPQRPVVRSSGEFYVPFVREGTDTHTYFGWYRAYGSLSDAETLQRHLSHDLRFVTEFGAQSFPNVESCLKFMPADVAAIDFAHLAERHSFQDNVMSNWLAWREARSLEELVEMTQEYQIFINRYYIDRLRYYKYRPTGGIAPFMFVDPYPAVLWSVVDYWRVPKRSYYAMQTAFNPQYAFTLFHPRLYQVGEAIDLPIYVVNDAQYPVHHARLAVRLDDPQGQELGRSERVVTLGADCLAEQADSLRLHPTLPGRYTLRIALTGIAPAIEHSYTIDVEG